MRLKQKMTAQYLLEQALLLNGGMDRSLFDDELKDLTEDMFSSLQDDRDEYLFAITYNNDHVSMILIETPDIIYINEKARDKLKILWGSNYSSNLKKIIPIIIQNLENGDLLFSGVKRQSEVL